MKFSGAIDLNAPAPNYARKDFPLLEADASVAKSLGDMVRVVFYLTNAWLVPQ